MNMSQSITPIGIVGGGFGALLVYTTLRFRGVPKKDIKIFSRSYAPDQTWLQFVTAINQQTMRSESVAHFFPTDSPGLATLEAARTWSLRPIILSWIDRYTPTVAFMCRHIHDVARQTGYWHSLVPSTVHSVIRHPDHFELQDEQGMTLGRVQHVVLAVGHGQMRFPEPVIKYRQMHPHDQRVIQAFENQHQEPNQHVLVVGDGLTAGTQWISVLSRGGQVTAVTLGKVETKQDLNTPRKYFSKRGIHTYLLKSEDEREKELNAATRGTVRMNPEWRKTIKKAYRTGRIHFVQGELINIEQDQHSKGVIGIVRLTDQHSIVPIPADKIVAATGFLSPATNPLLARLIQMYNLPTKNNRLMPDTAFSLPQLSTPHSRLFLIGQAAAWAIPSADSIGGMKITAREIASAILGKESWKLSELSQKLKNWAIMSFGKELPC